MIDHNQAYDFPGMTSAASSFSAAICNLGLDGDDAVSVQEFSDIMNQVKCEIVSETLVSHLGLYTLVMSYFIAGGSACPRRPYVDQKKNHNLRGN